MGFWRFAVHIVLTFSLNNHASQLTVTSWNAVICRAKNVPEPIMQTLVFKWCQILNKKEHFMRFLWYLKGLYVLCFNWNLTFITLLLHVCHVVQSFPLSFHFFFNNPVEYLSTQLMWSRHLSCLCKSTTRLNCLLSCSPLELEVELM